MARQRELVVTFVRERYAFDNDDGTRSIIGAVRTADGETLDIKGEAAEGELAPNVTYRLWGHTTQHPKYGEQFKFSAFVTEQPTKPSDLAAYIAGVCKGTGLGPSGARMLVDEHGLEAIDAFLADPGGVAKKLRLRLKPERAELAAERLREDATLRDAKVELITLLGGRGFPRKTQQRLLNEFGPAAAKVVRRTPYTLMKYPGCGFLGCDKLYLDLGHDPTAIDRQAHAIRYVLGTISDGHTWVPLGQLVSGFRRLFSGSTPNPDAAIEEAKSRGWIATEGEWVAEWNRATAEHRLAECVHAAMQEEHAWPLLADSGLSEHQQAGVMASLQGTVCALVGSPGTGKSYTAAAIVRLLLELDGEDSVAVCAPTGKAAVRMTEAMHDEGVEVTATTVHSLLGVLASDDGGGWSFRHNADDPLPHRWIILDEASMPDTPLMASLLAARAKGSHLLMLGDVNQLPPVGHGAPLRDMLTLGIPHGELTEIRRNSGRIVQACATIRDERRYEPSPNESDDETENLRHFEVRDPEQQIERLVDFLRGTAAIGEFDPVWDVQVVVAVNRKSPLGRVGLNRTLQELLNPQGKGVAGSPFRVGDKVICTRNSWLKSVNPDEGNERGEVFVANGDQGEVLTVERHLTVVRLQSPPRVVKVLRNADAGGEGGDDETASGCDFDLAYAISCHKGQGSGWPIVVVMLDGYGGARNVMSRQWLYTAISRAKKFCVTIGEQSTANDSCRRDAIGQRKTLLVERVRELRGETPEPVTRTKPEPVNGARSEPVVRRVEWGKVFAGV